MKISQTVVALLTTAILCISLVSCDRKLSKGNESNSENPKTKPANMLGITDSSTTYEPEKETEISTLIPQTQSTGTTTRTDTTVTPTKVITTASSTVVPETHVVPTTAPSTTAAKTTAAVTTTKPVATTPAATAAPTTAAPSTTAPTTRPVTTKPATTKPATTKPSSTEPPAIERPTDIIIDSEDMDSEQAVIAIVNRFRIAEGLGELNYSHELSAAAKIRAKELAVNYSHLRPDGTLWYTITPGVAGENIAKGFRTADGVTASWAKSEGHRKLMLTKTFTVTGVGCYYDNATDTYYWVQLFA